ncbi:hypothetical protein ABMA27_001353 [Loxostege sticticalis]|uniref:FLYWCH-type domain-containing protein n=1 Tax=Loxostege sticticalis TaxID=481309 RepID=A0ABR3HY60_LOXSC
MLIDNFTYYKRKGRIWTCSSRTSSHCTAKIRLEKNHQVTVVSLEHNHPPPKFRVTEDGEYIKVTTARGNVLIMVNDFTFCKMSQKSGKVWTCSSRIAHQCKAKFTLEKNDTITTYNLDHNHQPSSYYFTKDGKYVKLYALRGGTLLMVNAFTYYKQSTRSKIWVCTSKNKSRCEARVRLVGPTTVVPYNREHNHPPPIIHVNKDGKHIKVYE